MIKDFNCVLEIVLNNSYVYDVLGIVYFYLNDIEEVE